MRELTTNFVASKTKMIFFRDERWISVRYCSRPIWSLPNRSSWPSLSGWDTDCDRGPSSYSTPRRSTSLICITTVPLPTLSSGWAKDPSQMRPALECPMNSASESFSSFIDLCLWLQHSCSHSLNVLRGYQGEDIEIQLPDNLTVHDIDWLAVWCISFRENFGHIIIPKEDIQDVPPALGQNKLTVSHQRHLSSRTVVRTISNNSIKFNDYVNLNALIFLLIFSSKNAASRIAILVVSTGRH
jgi:Electron transfer DM13